MDVAIHLKRLPGDEAGTPVYVPHLPCSRRGLPSSISHLMDWCAFTAPFHLYNAQLLICKSRRCSLLSVALSIASPLLGVTQHPALWSPDFPHPDGKITLGTRPSTQLKPLYYIAVWRLDGKAIKNCLNREKKRRACKARLQFVCEYKKLGTSTRCAAIRTAIADPTSHHQGTALKARGVHPHIGATTCFSCADHESVSPLLPCP